MGCWGTGTGRRLDRRHERRSSRGCGRRVGGAGGRGVGLAVESAGAVDSRLPTAPWTNARAGGGRGRQRLRLPTLPTATTAAGYAVSEPEAEAEARAGTTALRLREPSSRPRTSGRTRTSGRMIAGYDARRALRSSRDRAQRGNATIFWVRVFSTLGTVPSRARAQRGNATISGSGCSQLWGHTLAALTTTNTLTRPQVSPLKRRRSAAVRPDRAGRIPSLSD
jgi:hypothetical protein